MRYTCALLAIALFAIGCGDRPEGLRPGPAPTFHDDAGPGLPGMDAGSSPFPSPPVLAPELPPPIIGGTLHRTFDGRHAVAADPDRDAVFIVNLLDWYVSATIALEPGDEPGRVVEDGSRRAHVVLRGAGAVATIDISAGTVIDRRSVCSAPRGIAYEGRPDVVHVACAGGELVTLPASGGPPTRTLQLDRDLRDVVAERPELGIPRLYVSRFRTAEILVLDASGAVVERIQPPSLSLSVRGREPELLVPNTAWRMVGLSSGGVAVLHQRAISAEVQTESSGGYGGGIFGGSGILQAAVTVIGAGSAPQSHPNLGVPVPAVDMAYQDGIAWFATTATEGAKVFKRPIAVELDPSAPGGGPIADREWAFESPSRLQITSLALSRPGEPPIGQSREPAGLVQGGRFLSFGGPSVEDTGHDAFHVPTRGGLACAACHPEGGDDGHVWTFAGLGPRRTQSLRGGIIATAPFHWDGELPTLHSLVDEVFVRRMSGATLTAEQVDALGRFVDTIPRLPRSAPNDALAVERGRAIFESTEAECSTCHTPPMFTNNGFYQVGTGGRFQVPTLLNVADRAPFMHDGCAPTLRDRFGTCGGGDLHGKTSHLTSAQIDDLVAFLETL